MSDAVRFRFDAGPHTYTALDSGEVLPSITQMLERTGWVDDLWYTDAARARGTAVHKLTADYDLGALDVARCVSPFRGYLLAHVAAMQILRPTILAVEMMGVHPVFRFAGRLDRDVVLAGVRGVLEGKSGPATKAHQVQTALQALLLSTSAGLPPAAIGRTMIYWKPNGKFRILSHTDRRDHDEARRVVRVCCGC